MWIISNVFTGFVRNINWIQHSPAGTRPLVWGKSPVSIRWLLLKIRRKDFCQFFCLIEIHMQYWSILKHRFLYPIIGGCGSETQIRIIDSTVQSDALPLLFLWTVFWNCTFERMNWGEQWEVSNKEEHQVENRLRECVWIIESSIMLLSRMSACTWGAYTSVCIKQNMSSPVGGLWLKFFFHILS